MTTSYEDKKRSTDLKAAKYLFSEEFARDAFAAGQHKPRGSAKGSPDEQNSKALAKWIEQEGHEQLARACLTYLLVIELKVDMPDERGFVELVGKIRDGAELI